MDLDKALGFIETNHHAVLLTSRRGGHPQMSPVLAGVAGGHIVISTRETAMKVHNIRRDPRVSLCVLADGFYGEWLQVDGTAEIVSLPEAMDQLVAYYRDISGEHPDWDDYREAMVRDRRVIVRVTPLQAGPDRRG
ncbi:PPOX class F420-dependent oxidoreductase [Nonomuraea sp. NPDC049684]|uniref:PPOX class F420-dependent oxidoreductase n=1 Tax=unclassified Nonomuraea TaxID=2593643 RepID=UPI0037A63B8E